MVCVIYLREFPFAARSLCDHVMRVFSRFIQAHPICIEFSLIRFNYERVCARANWSRVWRTRLKKQLNKSGASDYIQRDTKSF